MTVKTIAFIMLIFTLLVSCRNDFKQVQTNRRTDSRLELIGKYLLKIPEPSGLDFNKKDNTLWVVSDENGTLYKIATHGEILDSAKIDADDLEGVYETDSNTICVVEERNRHIVKLDSAYQIKSKIKLQLTGDLNAGLEGISYNPLNKHFYTVNEKKPVLFIELDEQFEIIKSLELNFAKDFSDIQYDHVNGNLWILSDESRALFKCDLNGKVLDQYGMDINQMEGLAIDFDRNLIYIVSDPEASLYVYIFKSGN